jgi:hypothetical protein
MVHWHAAPLDLGADGSIENYNPRLGQAFPD